MSISTFMPLFVGLSSLESMQQAESVVGNNISNATTPGYAEEKVNFTEANPFPSVPGPGPDVSGQFGQGVTVQSVTRNDSPFYDTQDRQNQSTYQMYSAHSSVLTQVESILNEPTSNSVQTAVDQFYQAWQTLANNPSSDASKQAVITQGQVVGQTFQTVTTQLNQLQSNLTGVINGQLQELNQYASQIASLNQQITSVKQSGENPNQLLDQQSAILDKMSQLANISYTPDTANDGGVNVTVGSGANAFQLVTGNQAVNITSGASGTPPNQEPSTANPLPLSNFQPLLSAITSGGIAGNVQGYDDAGNLLGNVGSFLSNLAGEVNSKSNQSFFTYNASTQTVSVGETSPSTLTTGPSGANSDGAYAQAVADSQNTSSTISWTYQSQSANSAQSETVSGTSDQQLAAMVSGVGTEAAGVNFSEQTANALQQQSSQLRQSVSGVSQDEQASLMIEYQNAYMAAAKYISTFQSMMQSLLAIA